MFLLLLFVLNVVSLAGCEDLISRKFAEEVSPLGAFESSRYAEQMRLGTFTADAALCYKAGLFCHPYGKHGGNAHFGDAMGGNAHFGDGHTEKPHHISLGGNAHFGDFKEGARSLEGDNGHSLGGNAHFGDFKAEHGLGGNAHFGDFKQAGESIGGNAHFGDFKEPLGGNAHFGDFSKDVSLGGNAHFGDFKDLGGNAHLGDFKQPLGGNAHFGDFNKDVSLGGNAHFGDFKDAGLGGNAHFGDFSGHPLGGNAHFGDFKNDVSLGGNAHFGDFKDTGLGGNAHFGDFKEHPLGGNAHFGDFSKDVSLGGNAHFGDFNPGLGGNAHFGDFNRKIGGNAHFGDFEEISMGGNAHFGDFKRRGSKALGGNAHFGDFNKERAQQDSADTGCKKNMPLYLIQVFTESEYETVGGRKTRAGRDWPSLKALIKKCDPGMLHHFFTLDELHKKNGTESILPNIRDTYPPRALLPNVMAKYANFGKRSLESYLKEFNVPKESPLAMKMAFTLELCNDMSASMTCVASLEQMADFVTSSLGPVEVSMFTGSKAFAEQVGKKIKVGEASPITKGDAVMVVCHTTMFPYKVYFCHRVSSTTASKVKITTSEGGSLTTNALCHKLGKSYVCHWFVETVIMFVPTGEVA